MSPAEIVGMLPTSLTARTRSGAIPVVVAVLKFFVIAAICSGPMMPLKGSFRRRFH
jgi:hypothetical protein